MPWTNMGHGSNVAVAIVQSATSTQAMSNARAALRSTAGAAWCSSVANAVAWHTGMGHASQTASSARADVEEVWLLHCLGAYYNTRKQMSLRRDPRVSELVFPTLLCRCARLVLLHSKPRVCEIGFPTVLPSLGTS